MRSLLGLLVLPLRAPLLLLLLLISVYLGMHWTLPLQEADHPYNAASGLIWAAECLQAAVVVVVCTMPDLLLRQISAMMAASRVISLVVTLLLVTLGGLYLLHLDVLSNVLILATAVLLARLDLVRIRIAPPPLANALALGLLVLAGLNLGRLLAP